jgi:NDP-sugar pyrophosphorylase family protein
MIALHDFIPSFFEEFPLIDELEPWQVTARLPELVMEMVKAAGPEYEVTGGLAIHRTAVVEAGAVLKPPVIIGAGCFVGAHAYLRGGVFLGRSVTIGTGCEIKTSIILSRSAIAHFNFIGDSVIGQQVNFEAGSITANHFNERTDKFISICYQGNTSITGSQKFGSLVGDHCKVGANAVLSPGTLLLPGTVVKRLELIDQVSP